MGEFEKSQRICSEGSRGRLIYFFDANIISAYAEPPIGSIAQSLHERARWTVERLQKERAELFIPLPSLMEYLVIKDPKHHAAIIAELGRIFTYAELDVPSTQIAAELLHHFHLDRAQRRRDNARLATDNDKFNALHAIDAQIVAIAKAKRGLGVFSQDQDIEVFGRYAKVPRLAIDTVGSSLFGN